MAGKKPVKSPKLDPADEEVGTGAEEDRDEVSQQDLELVVGIQNEIDRLNEQASEEILHVEQKYNKLRKPHFDRRSELIKKLPDFWLTTLLNNPHFSEFLDEDDETVLQYLQNLTVDEFEDVKSGYKINFVIRVFPTPYIFNSCVYDEKTNPYFDNTVLSKEFTLDSSGESSIVGTEINWRPGMDLTSRQSVELKGRKRGHEDPQSFFMWFGDIDTATSDDLAETVKDDIWPNPLQYFLGAEPSIDEGEGDGFEEEEEEEEDEEGLEDEDDDDPEEIVELEDEDEDDLDDEQEG